jgi:nitrite reductase/ring-hydroxylating ferredoxin subunit
VGCGCCADGAGRRAFLRHALLLVSGAVAGVAGAAVPASALPARFGEPAAASGYELTYPLPEADSATIDRDNSVIVVRYQGKVFAFNLSCPHENAAVRWKPAVSRFECSRHDSRYQPDGVYTSGRATRNMDRFAVRRNGSSLIVDVSRLIQSDTQKAQWEAAVVAL